MIHSSIHVQEEHGLTWNCWSMMACCSLCSLLLGLLMLTDRRHACSWWRGREQVLWLLCSSAWVWSLTVLCSVWERMPKGEVWSAREGSQRMEVVIRMDGGSCGHQLSSLVITAGSSTALAAPASVSARRPVRVNTCSVELCDLWFTVHITKF